MCRWLDRACQNPQPEMRMSHMPSGQGGDGGGQECGDPQNINRQAVYDRNTLQLGRRVAEIRNTFKVDAYPGAYHSVAGASTDMQH